MRRLLTNRVAVATALLPMLFGTLVLWALSDRLERIDSVPAAVVNLDEPVTTGKGEDREVVAAGRLLAAGLTGAAERDDHSLAWRLTTPDDASAGLREGDYYAVITIPKDFSATVAGLTRNDPRTAEITVRSNDAASALVGVVSDQIGEVAAGRLNQEITARFVEGMYTRTGELKASLGEAGKGADRLADGVVRLGRGTERISRGAGDLAGGLGSLAEGADRLASGSGRLSDGARRLADGGRRLRAGATELASGADSLAGGLRRLESGTDALPGQSRRLADGAGRIADGVHGWSRVLLAWKQACANDPVLLGSHAQLCAATVQAVGADGRNAEAMSSGARGLEAGTARLADEAPALAHGLDRASAGAGQVSEGARRLTAGTGALARASARLAGGAERLQVAAARLSGGADEARGGAQRLVGGTTRVTGGTARLTTGSRELADGLAEGAESIPVLTAAERSNLARAVARPVTSDAARLNAAPSSATSLVPGVLALAVWLGAFVVYLVRRALPERALRAAMSPARVALRGWAPAVAIGVVQGGLVFAALGLFHVALESPWGVAVFLLVPVAAFAALNQAFVAVLGPKRGWMLSIVFAVLQTVSLGGLVPVDTAPAAIRWLGGVLPVSLAAEGVTDLALGGRVGSVVGAGALLLLWGAAALAVTTVAAGRRMRVPLAEVRRRVAGVHAG